MNQALLPVAQFNPTARQEVFKITFFSVKKCAVLSSLFITPLASHCSPRNSPVVSLQGVDLGGWKPGDPECNPSRWRQIHLLCWERPGEGQQHGVSTGNRWRSAFKVFNAPFFSCYFKRSRVAFDWRDSVGNQRHHSELLQTLLTSSCLLLMNCSLDKGELTYWQCRGWFFDTLDSWRWSRGGETTVDGMWWVKDSVIVNLSDGKSYKLKSGLIAGSKKMFL